MSKTVDERVVSMQFDNKHFESNVKTTMSTLEKLKQSLNLSGASKGLESVNAAAQKCDLSPLSKSIQTVGLKFNGLYSMADQAFRNIYNSAERYAKQIVSAFTIDPIKTGFKEYELKMGSIQTIMASTGSDLETVNKYLNELNEYSDQTIYSFQDMTTNIGKFTNAGVKLEDAVVAIKGIANEAAVSGANANEAARAMYNFSQALSTGYVQRIDWKSIELANMATVEFKEQLLAMAIEMGTVEKNAEGMWRAVGDDSWYNTSQMFIETLDEQWLTSEVLIETLKDYADETTDIGKKAKAAATEVKTFTMLMDTLKESAQSGWAQSWEIIVGDFNEAKSLFTVLSEKIGGVISRSADKRNEFLTKLLDKKVLKTSAGQWDNLEKKIADAGVPLEDFRDTLVEVGKKHGVITDDMIKANGGFAESLKSGWASADIVVEALKKFAGGSDEAKTSMKDLLTYTVKSGDNLTVIAKKYGTTWERIYQTNKKVIGDNPNLIYEGQVLDLSEALDKLSDAQLKSIGYTEDEIKTLRGLQKQAKETNTPLAELIEQLEKQPTRRDTLLNSFSTLGEKLAKVINVVKETWAKVWEKFPGGEEIIGGLIDKFAAFVDSIDTTPETLDNIATSFEGLFRVIQIGQMMIGGIWAVAWKILNTVLYELDMNVLDVTTRISKLIIAFYKFITAGNFVYDIFMTIGKVIIWVINNTLVRFLNWIKAFHELENVKNLFREFHRQLTVVGYKLGKWFEGVGEIFGDFFDTLKNMENFTFDGLLKAVGQLGSDLIEHFGGLDDIFGRLINTLGKLAEAFFDHLGLGEQFRDLRDWIKNARLEWDNWVNGVDDGTEALPKRVGKAIADGIISLVTSLGSAIGTLAGKIWAAITGSAAGAKEGMAEAGASVASDLIIGLTKGIWNGVRFVGQVLFELGKSLIESLRAAVESHSPSQATYRVGTDLILGLANGLKDGWNTIVSGIKNLGKIITDKFSEFGKGLKGVFGWIVKFLEENFGSIVSIFTTILSVKAVKVLASSLELFANVLDKVVDAVAAVPKAIASMFKSFGKAAEMKAKGSMMRNFGLAILFMAGALFILAQLEWNEIGRGAAVLAGLAVVLTVIAAVLGAFVKKVDIQTSLKFAAMMYSMAAVLISIGGAIVLMALALKILDGTGDNIGRNLLVIIGAMVALAGVAALMSKIAPELSKGSLTMIGIAVAILLLVTALSKINALALKDPASTIGSLIALVAGLALIALLCKGVKAGAAIGMIGLVIALRLFVGTIERIAEMDGNAMMRSLGTIILVMGLFAILMSATKRAGDNALKAGIGIMAICASLLLVIAAVKMIAGMDASELARGTAAIAALLVVFALIVAMSHFAGKNAIRAGIMLIAVSGAMLLLAAAITILSFLKPDGLLRAVAAVSVLMVLFGVLIVASKYAEKAKGSLVAMAVTLGILVVAVFVMTMLSPEKLAGAVTALSALMIVFALLIASTKLMTSQKGSLAIMAGIMLIMGGIIIGLVIMIERLHKLGDPSGVVQIAQALALVVGAIAATCLVLSKAKGVDPSTLLAVAVMSLVVIAMGDVVKNLAGVPNPDTVIKTAVALSLLLLAIAGVCKILSNSGVITTGMVGNALLMSTMLIIIAGVLWAVHDLPQVNVINVLALGVLLEAVAAACLILSKATGINVKTVANALLVSVILVAIAGVLWAIHDLPQANVVNVLALGVLLEAVAAACLILSKATGINVKTVANAILASVIMVAIAGILWAIHDLPQVNVVNVLTLGVLLEAVAAACLILSKAQGINVKTVANAILASVIMVAIAGVLWAIHDLPQVNVVNVLTLGVLLEAVAAACLILSKAEGINIKTVGNAMLVTLILAEIALILALCSVLPMETGLDTVLALSVLLIAIAGVTAILSAIGPAATGAITAAASMMGVIAIIGAVIMGIGALMSLIPPETIEKWKTGLQGFMDFIVILAQGLGDAIGALIGGTLAGVGQGLSDFMDGLQGFIEGAKNIDVSAMEAIKALGAAILAITAASILDGLGKLFGLGSMDELGASLASFGNSMIAFADSIATLDETDLEKIKMAAEAGEAMAAMEGKVPKQGGWWQSIAGASDMADFGLRMEAFGQSLVKFRDGIDGLTKKDATLIARAAEAGEAMAGMEGKIPKQGGWWQTIAGVSDMASFGLRMEAFGKSLVKFRDGIAGLTAEDATLITRAADAGNAMSAMESSVPRSDGWWQSIAGEKDMETFGLRMEAFGKSLVAYATSVSGLPTDAATTIGNSKAATEALVEVSKIIPKDGGWWGDITGEQDIGAFGTGMASLATGLARYANAAATLPDTAADDIAISKDAVKALAEVADEVPNVMDFWGGVTDYSGFSTGMCSLANSLINYLDIVAGLEQADIDAITFSKSAIIAMADAAKALPNTGGVAGFFAGENDDYTSFGDGMCSLAKSVVEFLKHAYLINFDALTYIVNAKSAIIAMADAAKALPNDGGMVSWFTGENNDYTAFGDGMCALAKSVVEFLKHAYLINFDALTYIVNAKSAIIAMTDAAKALPNSGGMVSWFSGDNNDYTAFGDGMCALAKAVVDYLRYAYLINYDALVYINNSKAAIELLVQAASVAVPLGAIDLTNTAATSLGMSSLIRSVITYSRFACMISLDTLAYFANAKAAIDLMVESARAAIPLNTIDITNAPAAVSALSKIVDLARGMVGVDFTGMGSFATTLRSLGEAGVNQFIAAFSGSYSRVTEAGRGMFASLMAGMEGTRSEIYTSVSTTVMGMLNAIKVLSELFEPQGERLMVQFANGISRATDTVTTAVSTILSSARSLITNKYEYLNWHSAGAYLVDGFAAGITANTWKAKATATAMAQAALKAAKEALAINSPSKVFRELGTSVPEGFAMGIDKMGNLVRNSAQSMTDTALRGTKNAIAKLADMVDTDIDTQPTIRPVLDLSDVTSGARSINGLFNMTPSVGVLSNVGAISSSMNVNQNGANDDLISAINGLKDSLGVNNGDTININGITYDDGSNIANAIASIVREARVERRR